jgi:hypothetical protein
LIVGQELWAAFSLEAEAEMLKVPLTASVRGTTGSETSNNNYEREIVK